MKRRYYRLEAFSRIKRQKISMRENRCVSNWVKELEILETVTAKWGLNSTFWKWRSFSVLARESRKRSRGESHWEVFSLTRWSNRTLKSLRMENDGDSTSVLVFLLATTKGGEHNKFSLTLKTFVWKWLTSDILFQNRWRNAIYSVFGGGEGNNF